MILNIFNSGYDGISFKPHPVHVTFDISANVLDGIEPSSISGVSIIVLLMSINRFPIISRDVYFQVNTQLQYA